MKILTPLSGVEKKDFTYELKFLLPEVSIEPALAWARSHLSIDPHIKDATSDLYRVTSIYLDTPELHTYRRVGSFARSRYRVRRYAAESSVFLERKMKTRGIVGKRRVRVPDQEISKLIPTSFDPLWVGSWFHRRVLARNLQPRCQISYERVARVAQSAEGLIRFTLDRYAKAWNLDSLTFVPVEGGVDLLQGCAIMELKYQVALPSQFKELVDRLGAKSQAVSKYRLSIDAMGLAPKINGFSHHLDADSPAVATSAKDRQAMSEKASTAGSDPSI